jgi:hypothetical protein
MIIIHRGATGTARAPKLDKTHNTAARRRAAAAAIYFSKSR